MRKDVKVYKKFREAYPEFKYNIFFRENRYTIVFKNLYNLKEVLTIPFRYEEYKVILKK